MNTQVATLAPRASLVTKFAQRYTIEPEKLLSVLKATAFKQGANDPEVTNEQMAALLVVADQYGLNPFTREIYAFADKNKGVVPIVGIDGWSRIINDKPELDGIEFNYSAPGEPQWTECVIHRKDRNRPTVVREYMSECKRGSGPWNSHPSRMLRHKALIQCARVAFGFAGIYDHDEAERIVERDITPMGDVLPAERSATANLKAAVVGKGAAPEPEQAGEPPQEQKPAEPQGAAKKGGTLEAKEKYLALFKDAKTIDALDDFANEANLFEWAPKDMGDINEAYLARKTELEAV